MRAGSWVPGTQRGNCEPALSMDDPLLLSAGAGQCLLGRSCTALLAMRIAQQQALSKFCAKLHAQAVAHTVRSGIVTVHALLRRSSNDCRT